MGIPKKNFGQIRNEENRNWDRTLLSHFINWLVTIEEALGMNRKINKIGNDEELWFLIKINKEQIYIIILYKKETREN